MRDRDDQGRSMSAGGVVTFSTDMLPARDRFTHWREERGKAVHGVTIELDRSRHEQFRGRFSARPLGGGTLVDMRASAYRVARTEADVANRAGDALVIAMQVVGGGRAIVGANEYEVPPGTLSIAHSDLPYASLPAPQEGFRARMLTIPFARYRPLLASATDLSLRPVRIEPGLTALMAAHFDALVLAAPHLSGAAAETAVDTLAKLALMVRGFASPRDEPRRAAIHAGLLHQAQGLILAHLDHPDLSPAMVSDALGISVRHLHALFQPTGKSFSTTVMERRMDQARQLLAYEPRLPVTAVALACGFNSLSAFYRAFRAAHGMTSGEFRATLGMAD
ncbi:helix-turn-helix transcriptional regulator [Phreatobacter stygius]|uniref:Helix-turn-helix domain-containing protein n=1 Tax=Phreatobacter stygius TaxID=1940610 RepID=A0A4D7B9D8_9HYPH|nr:AraC family transcriptional regulator [Phreatobacter stygius]QCI67505.1 helix-turn-helix domain-containing protein [Phreatobacter stygius]